MARRHRTRTRTRRDPETTRAAAAPVRAEREESRPASRAAAHRPVRSRSGYARAAGAPSPTLERAAVVERSYVAKDFRRVAVVVAASLVVLIVAGFVESVVVK